MHRAVGAGLLTALIAILSVFVLSSGAPGDPEAVGLVKEAVSHGLAHYRAAQSAGGALAVQWSVAAIDGGGQTVEAVIRSSAGAQPKRAVFVVTARPRSVIADNDVAVSLLRAGRDEPASRP